MNIDLGQIESATVQTQVYQRLREALFTGLLAPGEAVTIRKLATMLGTSQMPVRESLQRLVAERALVQMPNRTFRVTPFTPEMFRELTRIRMSVEGLAAAEAARRVTQGQLKSLSAINKQMRIALRGGDALQTMRLNREFHFELYQMTDMPQLLDIINGLWLRAGPYLMNAHRSLPDPKPYLQAGILVHDRVIACCERRQPAEAGRAMACDIWLSARRFRQDVARINVGEAAEKAPRSRARSSKPVPVES
jgi:DNA-binding GntR family transcriptional regulator